VKEAMEKGFSVVVPTCNRPEDLRTCLLALFQTKVGADDFEVIVTDDGADDRTRAMLEAEFPGVHWTQGPRRGPAANRNHGVEMSRGEWIIFLDDDCVPSPGFLDGYEAAFRDGGVELVAFEGRTVREREPDSLLWEAPHNPSGGHLISCNFAILRRHFNQVGRFDERYPVAAYEDTEFAARFVMSGGRMKFLPHVEVIHPLRRRPEPKRCAARWEGKVIYAFDQGASPWRVRWGLPWHVFRLIQCRFSGQELNWTNVRAVGLFAREWWHVCLATPGWVKKWRARPRSEFWTEQVARRGPLPKYGF
jgi:GT2 family glycosyltransferase